LVYQAVKDQIKAAALAQKLMQKGECP